MSNLKIRRVVTLCGVCILAIFLCGLTGVRILTARASENAVVVMKTAERAEIRESPDENARTVLEVAQDTPLLVIGDTDTGWYQVQYRDAEGYLEKERLISYADKEELGQEFAAVEQDFQGGFAQVQQHENKKQQDRIWRMVIVLMAAAVAVLGVYALIRKSRKEKGGADGCRPM